MVVGVGLQDKEWSKPMAEITKRRHVTAQYSDTTSLRLTWALVGQEINPDVSLMQHWGCIDLTSGLTDRIALLRKSLLPSIATSNGSVPHRKTVNGIGLTCVVPY